MWGRLLIADFAPTRLGIRMALEQDVEICAEAGDAKSAIVTAKSEQPDICLVGLELPGGGMAAVVGICSVAPSAAVIVMATTSDVDELLTAVRAGAVGYVPGGIEPAKLRRVVRAALAHEAVIPRAMVLDLMVELRAATTPAADGLTAREAEVLGILRRGASTSAMAKRLGMSPVTVRRHISEIVRKVGVEDRAALTEHDRPDRAEPPGA
jgi:DNA-binding NarL/FixJ family response regulator